MRDIALAFDLTRGVFDYAMQGSQLVMDTSLATATILSFFVDKRAEDGDVLPEERPGPFGLNHKTGGDRRGNWGDFMTSAVRNLLPGQPYPLPAFRLGSRFWLFRRRMLDNALVSDAKIEAADCLAWMKTSGVATRITTTARAVGKQTLLVGGTIYPAAGSPVEFLFPILVGGGSYPLPSPVTDGEYGALGVFVLDQNKLS